MPNPNGKFQTLKPYESKWLTGKTQTIRVPVALAQQILAVVRQMDANESVVTDDERVNYQQCAWF